MSMVTGPEGVLSSWIVWLSVLPSGDGERSRRDGNPFVIVNDRDADAGHADGGVFAVGAGKRMGDGGSVIGRVIVMLRHHGKPSAPRYRCMSGQTASP